MATKTLGTLLGTTLTALQWQAQYANAGVPGLPSDADIATLSESILDDWTPSRTLGQMQIAPTRIYPGAFTRQGLLYVPNRGVLKILPGDWVAVDPQGWPILLSGQSVPATLTATGNTNTSTAITGLSTNVLNLGWSAGMFIVATTNADIPAGTQIAAIAANGLSLTLTKAATASNVGGTLTVSSWTHS